MIMLKNKKTGKLTEGILQDLYVQANSVYYIPTYSEEDVENIEDVTDLYEIIVVEETK